MSKGRLEQPLDSMLRGLGWDLVDKVSTSHTDSKLGKQM